MHHVADNMQTQDFQHLMVYQLDLHRPRCSADGTVTDRWASADHLESQDIPLLPIKSIHLTPKKKTQGLRQIYFADAQRVCLEF